ncbi:sarcosine oxidase subunit beta family protein [Paracoccus saliphilus]|uniref:Sarcosine oxidase subunit beta n=1 Tax=Paracoccus saliphilus TaxID=405559 RepID=A0AA45W509_9RHOB|nr:sarcosine oxidase subunit beta family protein [Paracoccus saliphilus]WCR02095.1 sarcosine oxidase subunit beta family protein [Paracoccus saliphilus]SIS89947.1 sarcosine oxidase subunit beta [Paracoccus saliphilus]
MTGFSAFRIFAEALRGNRGWTPHWRKADPAAHYDVVIIGGGGHGLSTAWHLASQNRGLRIAVLEKGPIGLGNTGRNTTVIRANYLLPSNQRFYEYSLRKWESFEQDLNYNAMVSQRGVLNLWHSDGQRDAHIRRGNTIRLSGGDAELLDAAALRDRYKFLDFDNARFPIKGGLWHGRGGTVRHDAVVWAYARAASELGVDIVENCEVTGFEIEAGRCRAVQTTRGRIAADKTAICVAGSSGRLAAMAGLRLPIESHVLQAFVSEGLKPFIDDVIGFGAGHFYISQSDKGGLVFGGDLDGYNSYAQRGNLPMVRHVCAGAMALMPAIGRARLLRSWGGIMDMTMDGSPIIDRLPVEGMFLNGGWCYGGFKSIPGAGDCFARLIVSGEPRPEIAAFRLDRFHRGHLIDEAGAGPWPNLH